VKLSPSVIRFLLEAGFLVLVAAAAGIAHLSAVAIIIVMAVAWALTALVERTAARESSARRLARGGPSWSRREADERTVVDARTVDVADEEEAARAESERRPFWRAWPARRDAEAAEDSAEIRHVRVIPAEAEAQPAEPTPSAAALTDGADGGEAASQPETVPAPAPVPITVPPVEEERPAETAEPPGVPPLPPAAAPVLHIAPEPEPAPAMPEPEPAAERVVQLPVFGNGPREWNLWDLERRARAREGHDAARDEEWALTLMHLRQFANADGVLPVTFDPLVRESFGDLLAQP
jgi:hypothetical protein